MKKNKKNRAATPQESAVSKKSEEVKNELTSPAEELAVTEDASAASEEAATENAPVASEEAATENAPIASEEAATENAPAASEEATTENAPAVSEEAPTEEASAEEAALEPVASEENALAPVEEASAEEVKEKKKKKKNEPMSDEEVYKVLGPQSVMAHLVQLVLTPIPFVSLLLTFFWISFGGTKLSVSLVAGVGALVLAVFAFWALGGSTNVNRRRFARAYFLSILVLAAIGSLLVLLAMAYGANLSPVLRRLIRSFTSLG